MKSGTRADRLLHRPPACERRAVRLAPDAPEPHFELAESLLVSGRLGEGWQEYDWRYRLPHAPPPIPVEWLTGRGLAGRPQWDGQPMAEGKLLLVADQGFGDVIQFARYVPMAATLCPNLIVACSAEMLPILRQQPGGLDARSPWDAVPDFEVRNPAVSPSVQTNFDQGTTASAQLPRGNVRGFDEDPRKVRKSHRTGARSS